MIESCDDVPWRMIKWFKCPFLMDDVGNEEDGIVDLHATAYDSVDKFNEHILEFGFFIFIWNVILFCFVEGCARFELLNHAVRAIEAECHLIEEYHDGMYIELWESFGRVHLCCGGGRNLCGVDVSLMRFIFKSRDALSESNVDNADFVCRFVDEDVGWL